MTNDESRERLTALCSRLNEEQLRRRTASGWTVAATLAHLGFWDRLTVERWKLFAAKPAPMELVDDIVNDAAALDWHAIPPSEAMRLVQEAAAAVDAHISGLPDPVAEAARTLVNPRMFERFHHRLDHLPEIEAAAAS